MSLKFNPIVPTQSELGQQLEWNEPRAKSRRLNPANKTQTNNTNKPSEQSNQTKANNSNNKQQIVAGAIFAVWTIDKSFVFHKVAWLSAIATNSSGQMEYENCAIWWPDKAKGEGLLQDTRGNPFAFLQLLLLLLLLLRILNLCNRLHISMCVCVCVFWCCACCRSFKCRFVHVFVVTSFCSPSNLVLKARCLFVVLLRRSRFKCC